VSALWSFGRGAGTVQDDPLTARAWRGVLFDVVALGFSPSEQERYQLEGCFAWRNNLNHALPPAHPYEHFPPKIL
jgi:hypothetical protein